MRSLTTFTSRSLPDGAPHLGSPAPYNAWNLGDHVGDDRDTVEANRAELARRLRLPRPNLVFMEQVHGAGVAVVDGPRDAPVPAVDALVTSRPGIGLAVLVADCVPVLLVDDGAGVAAAIHAGRRGVALGVVEAAVSAMRDLGARSIWGKLGPHIGPCCYEVGTDVQDEVAADLPVTRSVTRDGRPSLDLAAGLLQQLFEAGVEHLSSESACTAEDPQLFSYRRDGVTGRSAGVVVVRERLPG